MTRRLGIVGFLLVVLPWTVRAEQKISLIERIEADLGRDKAFTADERREYLSEFRQQLGSYAFDVLKDERLPAAEAVNTIVAEGSQGHATVAKTVAVAKAAYVAIQRGAPAEPVLGIALYAFQKNLDEERIAAFAKGFSDASQLKIPVRPIQLLVYAAVTRGWDVDAFRIYKQGLIQANKEGFDLMDFAGYLYVHTSSKDTRPGQMMGEALRAFRDGARSGTRVKIPAYPNPFAQKPAPPPPAPKLDRRSDPIPAPRPFERSEPMSHSLEGREPDPTGGGQPSSPPISGAPKSAVQNSRGQKSEGQKLSQQQARRSPASSKGKVKPGAKAQVSGQAAKNPRGKPSSKAQAQPYDPSLEPTTYAEAELEESIRPFMGVTYVWGGCTTSGTDCSGFVQSVFARLGVTLPRTAEQQSKIGQRVSLTELHKGDLIFFQNVSGHVYHVAIMVAPQEMAFVHASCSRGVARDILTKPYYQERVGMAKRLL